MKTTLKKLFAVGIVTGFTAACSFAQTLQWEQHYGTSPHTDVTAGGDGNIYVCNNEATLISYTPSGTQNWATTYTPPGGRICQSLATYGTGSNIAIYTAGLEWMTGGNIDMFLNKYNSSGVLQWTRHWGTVYADEADHITVDGSGNIYVTGLAGTPSSLNHDIFVRAYDPSGNLLWSFVWSGTGSGHDIPQEIRVNGSYVYVAGYTTSTGNNEDALLMKINLATGAIVWTTVWNNSSANGPDRVNSLAFGFNESVYTVGRSYVSTANGSDALLLMHNSSGSVTCSHLWNNSAVSRDDEYGSVATSQSSKATQIYATGYTYSSNFNANRDLLTAQFSTTCNLGWVQTYNGTKTTCPYTEDISYQVLYSYNTGKVYITGVTEETSGGINYTTIRYDASTGTQEWFYSYDRASAANEPNFPDNKHPMAIRYDACHLIDEIYVAGYTYTTPTSGIVNGTLVKYGLGGPCSSKLAAPDSGEEQPVLETAIYPNPFTSTARFVCSNELNNASLLMYDLAGREVKRIDNISTSEIEISSGEMNTGLYFYRLIQDNEIIASGKFMIEK
jgi:hypothetical protein